MARRHPIAVSIKQHTGEEARLAISRARVPLGGIAGKLSLNGIPQRLIDDRRVLARMGLLLVNDLASVNAVLQHQVERAVREWLAALQATRSARPRLAFDPAGFQLVFQQSDRAEFGFSGKDYDSDLRQFFRPIYLVQTVQLLEISAPGATFRDAAAGGGEALK